MQHASYEWRIFWSVVSSSQIIPPLQKALKRPVVSLPRVLRKEGWGAWAAATTQRWQEQPASSNFWLFKGWGLCCKRWGDIRPVGCNQQKSDHPKLGAYDLESSYLLEGIMQRYQRWEIWETLGWRIKCATAWVHHHRSFSLSYPWTFE